MVVYCYFLVIVWNLLEVVVDVFMVGVFEDVKIMRNDLKFSGFWV